MPRVHTAHVQIGGDGIGRPALLDRRNRLAEQETAPAMAHVEDNAALAGFGQIGQQLLVFVQHRHRIEIHMRGDVAGAQFFCDQILIGPLRAKGAEINHDRHVREGTRFNGSLHRYPFGTIKVGGLDANDHARNSLWRDRP